MSIGIMVGLEYKPTKSDQQFSTIIRAGDFFVDANRDFVNLLKIASGQNDIRSFDLPVDASVETFLSFYVEVIDDKLAYSQKPIAYQWCFASKAAEWARRLPSVRQFEVNGVKYIHNPSYFNPGIITLSQIGQLEQESDTYIDVVPSQFILLVDFMKCIDTRYYGGASRLVYWFD